MNNVYIDCNIINDWILDRMPFSPYAAKLISLIEKKEVNAYISPLILANTYYIIKKERDKIIAEEFLNDCKKLFRILDITQEICLKAIDNKYKDFEDDLHYYTAIYNKIDYIITRNKVDFHEKGIKIRNAEEYLIEINEL